MSLPSSEQWRPVVGYEGYYEVSDLGRVRSLDRWITTSDGRQCFLRGRPIKIFVNSKGYPVARLGRAGRSRGVTLHLVVLAAFVGPRPAGMEGCHTDGVKTNCTLSNLRWDTRRANDMDKVRHGAHHHARKTHCPRRHLLADPNLVAATKKTGHRNCKACNRAHALVRKARLRGEPHDFEAWADDQYARLMRGACSA